MTRPLPSAAALFALMVAGCASTGGTESKWRNTGSIAWASAYGTCRIEAAISGERLREGAFRSCMNRFGWVRDGAGR